MTVRELPQEVLRRAAVVYIRQSTGVQVQENLESQRRQYDLVELAKRYASAAVAINLLARRGVSNSIADEYRGTPSVNVLERRSHHAAVRR